MISIHRCSMRYKANLDGEGLGEGDLDVGALAYSHSVTHAHLPLGHAERTLKPDNLSSYGQW